MTNTVEWSLLNFTLINVPSVAYPLEMFARKTIEKSIWLVIYFIPTITTDR